MMLSLRDEATEPKRKGEGKTPIVNRWGGLFLFGNRGLHNVLFVEKKILKKIKRNRIIS